MTKFLVWYNQLFFLVFHKLDGVITIIIMVVMDQKRVHKDVIYSHRNIW